MTPVVMDLTLRILGDKSPKATHKYAVQKRVKADAAKQNKNNAASAEQVPKTKKKKTRCPQSLQPELLDVASVVIVPASETAVGSPTSPTAIRILAGRRAVRLAV